MSIAAIGGYLVNEPSDAEFAHVGRTLVSSAHPQPAPHRMTPGPRPRVSLVTVTFNAAGFISPFCEAVSRLSYPALEVLIVDNASHDGTAAVLRRALPRATVIQSRRNRGFAAGCNLGAAAASGDVLFFAAPTLAHLENQSIGPTLPYSVRRNRMLFLARNADPEHPYRALGREASRLYRAHVRPLLAALLGAHPWKLRDAWRDWRPAMPGDLAGFALALLAARRTGPHGALGPDRSGILCSPAAPDGQDR